MRILIAEDEMIDRRILESTLTGWGHEVVVATNGRDAWSILQEYDAPRLAILDVMMPGLQGVEICRRVRQAVPSSPTYIILLTSRNGKKELVTGLEAGADEYLVKPFDRDELYARVQVGARTVEAQNTLLHLSVTDELTGLLNRRGFLESAERELKLECRTQQESLLFYFDMDGLKQINDKFGHEEGSQAICRIARILKATFRETDLIGRMGGDEFTVLAIGATYETKQVIIDRLEELLRQEDERNTDGHYELRMSKGVVGIKPDGSASIEELLTEADSLMYEQKRAKKGSVPLNSQSEVQGSALQSDSRQV